MVTEISHPSFEAGESRKQASVTLLIPQKHWQLFCGLKHKLSKDSSEFLEHLLENFQNGQNPELYNRNKLTTQYQSESLELQKHNFWVDPVIWHRFKILARFYGVSICFLFTALLYALKNLGAHLKKSLSLCVQLFEKLKIPYKMSAKSYEMNAVTIDTS